MFMKPYITCLATTIPMGSNSRLIQRYVTDRVFEVLKGYRKIQFELEIEFSQKQDYHLIIWR